MPKSPFFGVATVERDDISDLLLASLMCLPDGYTMRPKTRHQRRANKALMRTWHTLRLGPMPPSYSVTWLGDFEDGPAIKDLSPTPTA